MPNFESEGQKSTEAQRPAPEQQVYDERYAKPVDINLVVDIADHFIDASILKCKTASGLEQKGAEARFDEFSAIYNNLMKYTNREISGEELISQFKRNIFNLKRDLDSVSEHRKESLIIQINGLESTVRFVSQQILHPLTAADLKQMNHNLFIEKDKFSERQMTKSTNETDQTFSQTESGQANTEQEKKEKLLIEQVLLRGGANIMTSFGAKESPFHNGGFADRSDGKVQAQGWAGVPAPFGTSPSGSGGEDDVLTPHNVAELVYVAPQTEDIVEQRTRYVEEKKGGIMGFGAKTVQRPVIESVVVGHKPASMEKFIADGGQEPAYKIYYKTLSNDNSAYVDYSNSRGGNYLGMELVLPESITKQVITETQRNPEFFHRLIDQIAIQNIGIDQEAWFKGEGNGGVPLRPPYDKIHQTMDGERKMYILEKNKVQDSIDQGIKATFDPSCVKSY